MDQDIGEKLDGSPVRNPHTGKKPAAVALGRLGGQCPDGNVLRPGSDSRPGEPESKWLDMHAAGG